MREITPQVVRWLMENVSCKRFAHHVAAGERPLEGGLYRKMHFWLHWAVCPFCRRYWKEIQALGEVQRANSVIAKHPAVKLPEVKARLKERLMRKLS